MKKINIYIKGLLVFLLTAVMSCQSTDDFLERINPNELTQEVFWQNESDVRKAIMATYGAFAYGDGRWDANVTRWFAWAFLQRGDTYYAKFQGSWGLANAEFGLDATNRIPLKLWKAFYATIARANVILENVPTMENLEDDKKKAFMGEAQFLRGLSYFYLINLWKDIPLVTQVPILEEDYIPGQASREEVWAQIENDFMDAKANLAEVKSWSGEDLGRATWGSVVGHLGKAYLYQQKWTQAAAEFDVLINSGIYDLVSDYRDNCNDLNENNVESIFEIQFNHLLGQPFSTWRARDIGPRDFARPGGVVEPWVVKLFQEETTVDGKVDPRALASITFPHPDSKIYGGITYEEAYGSDATEAYLIKYCNIETAENDNNGWASGVNIRLMRLADVLLMHAEAENEANGPSAAALASFNRVRERANMAQFDASISKDDFRNAIRRERVLELTGEDNRWMDLKRWGTLEERFTNPEVLSGELFDINRHEYYPIPQIDINSNPNLQQYSNY